MSRWALPLAAATLLAVAALVLAVGLRSGSSADRAAVSALLATELRCPDCEGLAVAESPSRSAAEIRRRIDALLAEGRTPDEVRQHFVDRYGDWILLAPRSPLPWLMPPALALAALLAYGAWLRRRGVRGSRHGTGEPSDAAASTETVRRRVAEEAEALDA